jgi:hypothetical protein
MAKKIKVKVPPLSGLDKFIYVMGYLVDFALLAVFLLVFGKAIPEAVAFSDPSVVARHGEAGLLCAVPMTLLVTFTPAILVGCGWDRKQPIFGNKKFKPKFGQPVIKTFPLFSKEFRQSLTEKQVKRIKRIAAILLIVFVVFAVILSLGIYPRTVLDSQNRFKAYNSFNQLTDEVAVQEADRLTLEITYHTSRRGFSRSWGIQLTFAYEHRDYKLALGGFGDMEREDVLRYMLSLKDYFKDGRYEILSTEWMDRLIDDKNFTATEQKLVYDLFDYTP